MNHTKIAVLSLLAAAIVPAIADESGPLYRLDFTDGSFANTGSVGGAAEQNPAYKGPTTVQIESDDKNIWSAKFDPYPNGARGPSLELPDSSGQLRLGGADDTLTVAAWVKWNGPDQHPDDKQPIVWKAIDNTYAGWIFSLNAAGGLRFDWKKAGGGGSQRFTEETIPVGEWHHVAMVWKNADPGGLTFYIDGSPVKATVPYTGGGPLESGDNPIIIGANPNGHMPLNGSLRGLQLFNRALEPEEIAELAKP